MADILKRQRGSQYRFGDDINSEEMVTRNMSNQLLNDGDITTKAIENFFGDLDRGLRKAGLKIWKSIELFSLLERHC